MSTCKFPGMTRDQYDKNMAYVKNLCQPQFRRVPDLSADGLPDMAGLFAAAVNKSVRRGLTAFGLPALSGMYRPVERSKTGLRECARRVRHAARNRGDI